MPQRLDYFLMVQRQAAQHAVDKARGAVGAIDFGKLDRLIDGDFERRLL